MARIRTIKPEFFTSEDIVALSPLARLLYIALWCEADRDGRLAWKPRTFKMRYLPADDCDIEELCAELVSGGLVKLYGDGFGYIPKFGAHQHLNPREAASTLPDPFAKPTRAPRVSDASPRVPHASASVQTRDSDATVTRREEGKGREGNVEDASEPDARASRLPSNWAIPVDWAEWAKSTRPDLDPASTAEQFRDYWCAKPGKDGRKLDWMATWRNWVKNQRQQNVRLVSGADIFAGAK